MLIRRPPNAAIAVGVFEPCIVSNPYVTSWIRWRVSFKSESRKQVGLFLGVERSPEGRATVQSHAFSAAAVKTFEKDGHVSQDLVQALLRKQWASPVFYKTCGEAHVAGVQLPIYLLGLILRCITHLSTIKSRQWIRQSLSARL